MAQSSVVARRYARAYFDLAAEAGAVAAWRGELDQSIALVTQEEMARALANPRLRSDARSRAVLTVLEGTAAAARNLVRLLVERGRAGLLPQVLGEFDRLADRASGVVRAEVTSAVPLDGELERRIAATLSEQLGGDVQTTVRQDPDILGGLVVRIGDRVIDASIRTRLQHLQASLA